MSYYRERKTRKVAIMQRDDANFCEIGEEKRALRDSKRFDSIFGAAISHAGGRPPVSL